MRKTVILIASVLQITTGFGQYLLPGYTAMPDKVPAEFRRNYENELSYVKSKVDYSNIPDTLAQELLYENLATSGTEALTEGEIFYNWPEASAYLNDVLKILIKDFPDDIKKQLKIYPGYSPDMNASCYYNGTIIFDMGSFNYLKNEAQVAALLAHEISHFLLTHSYLSLENKYNNFDKLPRLYNFLGHKPKKLRIEIGQFSQKQELEADSLGLEVFVKAGYAPNEYLELEKTFIKLEKSLEQYKNYRLPTKRSMLFSTHPTSELRLKKITEWYNTIEIKQGSTNFLGEDRFTKILQQTPYATIAMLNKLGEYYALTEFCFINYLYEPENKVFVYYLLEGIRKYCFINAHTWNNSFLADRYKGWQNIARIINRKNSDKIIADGALIENSNQVRTYSKAFKYFSEKAEKLKINESYLTIALGHYDQKDNKLFTEFIDNYLKFENIENRDYANFIKDYKAKSPYFNDSTLVILGDFHYIEYKKNSTLKNFELYKLTGRESLDGEIEKVFTSSGKKVKFYNSFKNRNENLNQYFDQFIYSYAGSNLMVSKDQTTPSKNTLLLHFDPSVYKYYIKNHGYKQVYILDYNIKCKSTSRNKLGLTNCECELALLRINLKNKNTIYLTGQQPLVNLNYIIKTMLIYTKAK